MKIPITRYNILDLIPPGPVIGVEVGTDTGINARELLLQRPDLFLWTVDPFKATKAFPEVGRGTALRFYEERVGEFVRSGRSTHLQIASVEAARVLLDRGVVPDFVYIDGCHEEASVRQDLAAWFPLLRVGGLLAGHDFEAPSVHTPVIQFARDRGLDLYVLNEHGDPDIVPPELRGPLWTRGHGFDKHGGWAHPTWILFKE